MNRKLLHVILIVPLVLLSIINDAYNFQAHPDKNECTIGIFTGSATTDGRPIIWKNRDVTNAVQKFCFFPRTVFSGETTFAYIANTYSPDTTKAFMGLNETGFVIINSNTYNLNDTQKDGVDDGAIIRYALEKCRTIYDFEHILDMTSIQGRRDCWNFGAIDAYGNGAMYECGNFGYTKYDVHDTLNEGDGILLRATFSLSGGDSLDGFSRYKRATQLVTKRIRIQPVDVQFVLQTLSRDLANPIADPYPLPYNGVQNGHPAGFILSHNVTITRDVTRSLMIVKGVAPGENPALSTMYVMLGPPVLSVAYPLWVESHCIPQALNYGTEVPMYTQVMARHAKLYPLSGDNPYINSRYLVGKNGVGLYTYTIPLETSILNTVENYVDSWRLEFPGQREIAQVQTRLADSIYNAYHTIPLDFPQDEPVDLMADISISNYPNPFNATTAINLSSFGQNGNVKIEIYDILGQKVRELNSLGGRESSIVWDGRDESGNSVSSGVYLIRAADGERSATLKALLLK
jgi:hypothetical protein